jgi:hypothetical protein
MKHFLTARIAALVATLFWAHSSFADGGKFSQSEAMFKSREDAFSLVAQPSMVMIDGGTIEFWVSPQWTKAPAFDPTVLSHLGEDGVNFSIHITKDRKGIGLNSGDDWAVAPYDFTKDDSTKGPPTLRHVALVTVDDLTEVLVDGERIALLNRGFFPVESQTFHIGSFDGYNAPFRGYLAGIRIWRIPLDHKALADFKRVDIAGEEGLTHPEFWALLGASDFSDGKKDFYVTVGTEVPQ